MDPLWLLVPFIALVPVKGVRLFLLQLSVDKLAANNLHRSQAFRMNRFKAIGVPWYIWLLRDVKDWFLLGALGGVSVGFLAAFIPWLVPSGLVVLSLLLILTTCIAVVILLYSAGYRIPEFLVSLAVRVSIPDLVPANRRRAGSWGFALIFTGGAGLFAWYLGGKSGILLWSFVTITLGTFSLLRAASPSVTDSSEVNLNA